MASRSDPNQLGKSKALRIQAKALASKVLETEISTLLANGPALRLQFCAAYRESE
jgi:hypothetical protein